MDWKEFLKGEAVEHGLSLEQEQTLLAALPDENAEINQLQLATSLNITKAAVKSRMAEIYKKFEMSIPNIHGQQGAGKFEILRKHLKQKFYLDSNRIGNNPTHISDAYSEEFKPLIKEKIRSFCGREFVFTAFANFLKNHPKGYFTVIGDAGMGKSAIVAKYVDDHKTIHYFNVLQEGRNTPESFLKSIRQQLINRYNLQNAETDDLSALLVKVSPQIKADNPLVIVVDALDEVEQKDTTKNILELPKTLPDNVYFLLTRRRYEEGKERLFTEGVSKEKLDLTANQYNRDNRDDIQNYIRFFLNHDPDHQAGLKKWIADKKIADNDFIEQVAAKSENNFMYLRYVLPGIAQGLYNDLTLKQLPQGLQQYYATHWARMGMDNKPQEIKVIILFILVEIGTPIPCEMIAEIAKQDTCDVQSVLDEWVEYLKPQVIAGENCYSIYHASFLEFLKAKRVLDSKRQLFEKVNQHIADYLVNRMA